MGALRFDAFVLDPSRRVLMRGNQAVTLRPQAFDVLLYLARHSGEAVTNKQLIENLWDDPKHVKINTLARCIKDIRDALEDADRTIIRTVRHGYLFGSPVSLAPLPSTPAAPSHTPPDATGASLAEPAAPAVAVQQTITRTRAALTRPWIAAAALMLVLVVAATFVLSSRPGPPAELTMMAVPTMAVLPLKAAVERASEAAGTSTLADEISTELARVPRGYDVLIKPATGYKDMGVDFPSTGRALSVRYLILGAVRRDGDTVHVNVQLIEAETARQIWARPFDYAVGTPGAQHLTAAHIARLVTDRITRAESRRPLPAKVLAEHYAIMGRALTSGRINPKVSGKAIALFKKGLEIDSNSGPALRGYAQAKISALQNGWAPRGERTAWLDEADAAITRILDLNPHSAGAYRLRGALHRARHEPDQAIQALEQAVRLNSSYGTAYAELGRAKIEVGRAAEGIADIGKALALSPADPARHIWSFWAGQAALHIADHAAALRWLEGARQTNPKFDNPRPWIAVAYAGLGQLEKARAEMKSYLDTGPDFTVAGWNRRHPRHNPVVATQRARIARVLAELGAPAGTKTPAKHQ